MSAGRFDRAAPLLEHVGILTGSGILSQQSQRAAVTRRARARQEPLPLPSPSGPAARREASHAELRELLVRLPLPESRICSRRDLRAKRTALARGWVVAQGEELHATAAGRDALEALLTPGPLRRAP